MPRLSMNEMTTYRWSFDEDVQHYRAAGIPAIGVWRRKLSDFGEQRGIELLKESGLAVSNLLWAGGFTGSEGHTFRESVDDAVEAIRLAGAMQRKLPGDLQRSPRRDTRITMPGDYWLAR